MKPVKIRNVVLGEGAPKIAVPLVAEDEAALAEALAALKGQSFDLVEFRADFFTRAGEPDYVLARLRQVRNALPDTPLLFTFRRAEEGGAFPALAAYYFDLLHAAVRSGLADAVDIELFAGDGVRETVELAHRHGMAALLCNHDFNATPPKEEIIGRLKKMQDFGADICKIAVMPQSAADVLVLLDATQTAYRSFAAVPLATMAMGGLGAVSRLAGATFGSALTFGAAGRASAPGQIGANDLRFILNVLGSGH